jgi:small subunit ribosomal protein S1
MKDLLEQNNSIKPAQVGKIVEGKIVGHARSAVFLDLGPMGTGIIYGREFQQAKDEIKNLKIGDSFFAKIIDLENEDGYIELSLSQASDELTWERLREQKDKGEILKVKITSVNKGGLVAEVFGIPAFLPVSQLMADNYPRVEKGEAAKIVQELQKFVDQEMEVKIFDLDSRQGKLILSEKAKEDGKIREILKDFKLGDVVEAEITGITDFGVFVRFSQEGNTLDFVEGLIHISELDWQLIENPADVVKVGQTVKAKIISISDNKVSLSLKALKEDPWQGIEEKYKKGDTVKGKVTKFNPYGAFIQITPQIQGLCHISEFGTNTKMEEALQIDQTYKFQISSIEPKEHRMILKLEEK